MRILILNIYYMRNLILYKLYIMRILILNIRFLVIKYKNLRYTNFPFCKIHKIQQLSIITFLKEQQGSQGL